MTFEKYVARARIERAKQMLLRTSLSVDRIAKLSGFNSSQYFTACSAARSGKRRSNTSGGRVEDGTTVASHPGMGLKLTMTATSRVRRHLTSALLAASMLACGGTSDVSKGDASDDPCAACSKTVHRPISCTCPGTALSPAQTSCVFGGPALRSRLWDERVSLDKKSTGCGKVQFSSSNAVGSLVYTFDAASGELVGKALVTDVAGECGGYGTLLFGPGTNGGNDECASVESCVLCEGDRGTSCRTGAGLPHCM